MNIRNSRRYSWMRKALLLSGSLLLSFSVVHTVLPQLKSEDSAQTLSDAAKTPELHRTPQVILIEPAPLAVKDKKVLRPVSADLSVQYVDLGAMQSDLSEGMDDFLIRVAQTMDWFTRSSGFEACGVIMKSNTQDVWQVRLTTNRSRISCEMVEFPESGFTRISPDIHSHPYFEEDVFANAQDIRYNSNFKCGDQMFIYDDRFSKRDFSRGDGYLVTRGQLLYQHGERWPIRQVAVFNPLEEAPELSGPFFANTDEAVLVASHEGEPESEQEVRVDPLKAAATAVWLNQVDTTMLGVPTTSCPSSTEDFQ